LNHALRLNYGNSTTDGSRINSRRSYSRALVFRALVFRALVFNNFYVERQRVVIVELAQAVTAEIVEGLNLQLQPRLWLTDRTLLLGPYHSFIEQERHFLQTVGFVDWLDFGLDVLTFDRYTSLLQGAVFHIPETNSTATVSLTSWLDEDVVNGSLRLSVLQGFQFELADIRWMDVKSDALYIIRETTLEEEGKPRLRLHIAQDLDLLFISQRLRGILLFHPTAHLVNSWHEPGNQPVDDHLMLLLNRYLELVADPYIERMEGGDLEILQLLVGLGEQISLSGTFVQQRDVLRIAVEDIISRFYGEKLFS